jgi:hypothetical protein
MKQKYLSDRNKLLNLSYRYSKEHPDEIPNQYDLALVDLYIEAKKHGIVLPEHGHFTKDHKSLKLDKHEK